MSLLHSQHILHKHSGRIQRTGFNRESINDPVFMNRLIRHLCASDVCNSGKFVKVSELFLKKLPDSLVDTLSKSKPDHQHPRAFIIPNLLSVVKTTEAVQQLQINLMVH
jgi:hypothetical protein